MNATLHGTLDQIHAEQQLKDRTAAYLQMQLYKRKKPARPVLHAAMAIAVVAVFALAGLFSFQLYAAPSAYIDLDVNPSIELTVNRFGRVLSAQAYNGDGETLLQELNLRHMACEDVLGRLLEALIDQDYLADGLISVTVQGDTAQELTATLKTTMDSVLSAHHAAANTEVSAVSPEVKKQAREHHMSPAKYLAIQELQEVDPAATFESCAGHSLGELRDRAQHHGPAAEDANHGASAQGSKQDDRKSAGQHHAQEHGGE